MIRRVAGSNPLENVYGYSRAVVAGDWALSAGTTATVNGQVVHPGDPYRQAHAAFKIALDALREAGFDRAFVVRTRMYVIDMGHQSEIGRAHKDLFGEIRPVATMVEVAALADPDHLIEVDVDAYRPASSPVVVQTPGGTTPPRPPESVLTPGGTTPPRPPESQAG